MNPRAAYRATKKKLRHLSALPQNLVAKGYTQRCRLAVVGHARAGKTVFLTSLINHLLEHNPQRFQLHGGEERLINATNLSHSGISNCASEQPGNWQSFPYQAHRQRIANEGEWPEKTHACGEYSLAFETQRWRHRYELTLMDVPGERFSDAGMLKADYVIWSQEQLDLLQTALCDCGTAHKSMGPVREFLRIAKRPGQNLAEQTLITAYKKALFALRQNYFSHISPSTFRLAINTDGWGEQQTGELTLQESIQSVASQSPEFSQEQQIERIVARRLSGLPDAEFCPLEPSLAGSDDTVAEAFRAYYQQYQTEVVFPLFRRLVNCDGVAVLFDVADILAAGPHRLNEATRFSDQLVAAFHPEAGLLRWLAQRLRGKRRAKRFAIIAAQCDRCHPDDADYLCDFVDQLCGRKLLDKGIDMQAFACAAVQSTDEFDSSSLRGCLAGSSDATTGETKEPAVYEVSRIPERDFRDRMQDGNELPGDWDPKQFRHFPRVRAAMPKAHRPAPRQQHLDKVFCYLLNRFLG